MRLIGRWVTGLAVFGSVAALLIGCVLVPQPSESIEDLVGVWEFVDKDGVVSTMTIAPDGTFEIDRAPVEAFRVLEQLEVGNWDGEVDWDRAMPSSGVVSIGTSGQVRFSTREPEWGGSAAYENPLRNSVEFVIGNPDNQDFIDYVRVIR